jgi:hypothetical protein
MFLNLDFNKKLDWVLMVRVAMGFLHVGAEMEPLLGLRT